MKQQKNRLVLQEFASSINNLSILWAFLLCSGLIIFSFVYINPYIITSLIPNFAIGFVAVVVMLED